jgi:hypothetical protein
MGLPSQPSSVPIRTAPMIRVTLLEVRFRRTRNIRYLALLTRYRPRYS